MRTFAESWAPIVGSDVQILEVSPVEAAAVSNLSLSFPPEQIAKALTEKSGPDMPRVFPTTSIDALFSIECDAHTALRPENELPSRLEAAIRVVETGVVIAALLQVTDNFDHMRPDGNPYTVLAGTNIMPIGTRAEQEEFIRKGLAQAHRVRERVDDVVALFSNTGL